MQRSKDPSSCPTGGCGSNSVGSTLKENVSSVPAGVIGALVAAQCFFGLSPVVSRAWVSEGEGVGYAVFLTYRCMIGSITLLVGAALLEGEGFRPPRHIAFHEFLALSGLGVISSLTFLFAIGFVGSFLPALGETLIPVYVCAVCVLCRFETVRRGKVAGVACAVAGALLIVAREESRKNTEGVGYQEPIARPHPHLAIIVMKHVSELWVAHPTAVSKGLLLIVFHIIAAGSYWTLKKQLLYRASPLHLSSWANMLSTVLAFCAALWCGRAFSAGTWIPTTKNMLALSFSTLESVFGTGLTAWATKRAKATVVVSSMTLQPMFSSFFSWILFGTTLQGDHALGMLLTSTGLILVAYSQNADDSEDSVAEDMKKANMKLLP
eukprot:TRINITY_DN16078_c0_g1_i1.p1 TRINITY_DN16078_c0_g1~~TRINITY_DN16078_c0_g1_i1.p1  ORF type:complete len:380 (+),score=51.91 TRINITY_DN16078_c0_g1_i1:82-1221(+)